MVMNVKMNSLSWNLCWPDRYVCGTVKGDGEMLEGLGMTLPIIQAPMAGVSTPALAAAVSNAGGLGSIGIGASDVAGARG